MLQFDVQFYEELTARVKIVKFISGAFFLADRSACFILGIEACIDILSHLVPRKRTFWPCIVTM